VAQAKTIFPPLLHAETECIMHISDKDRRKKTRRAAGF
jgi:hypothetical protein